MATTEVSQKQVMVVGIDDSDFSMYALEWTLDHLLAPTPNPIKKLVLVYAKPSIGSAAGLVGPGRFAMCTNLAAEFYYEDSAFHNMPQTAAADVLPIVDADLKRTAARIVEHAKELCIKKSVKDPVVEVVDGDPRNVLCDAVEKHHASILVVGSHGYGVIKRAVLGSVSDYCAHHANCTVMIVKKPKTKAASK